MMIPMMLSVIAIGLIKSKAFRSGFRAGCADVDAQDIRLVNRVLKQNLEIIQQDLLTICKMAEYDFDKPDYVKAAILKVRKVASRPIDVTSVMESFR